MTKNYTHDRTATLLEKDSQASLHWLHLFFSLSIAGPTTNPHSLRSLVSRAEFNIIVALCLKKEDWGSHIFLIKSSVIICLFVFLCCFIKENEKWGANTVSLPKGKHLFIYIDVWLYPLKWAVCYTSIFYVPFLCGVTFLLLDCAGLSVRSCYSARAMKNETTWE